MLSMSPFDLVVILLLAAIGVWIGWKLVILCARWTAYAYTETLNAIEMRELRGGEVVYERWMNGGLPEYGWY